MNRRHTSAAFSAAGFLWLFALLFVVVIGTPLRVLVPSFLLVAAVIVLSCLRQYRRRFRVPSALWNPAPRGNT